MRTRNESLRIIKTFNTAGPSVPGDHYMLDPLARIDLAESEALIKVKCYFLLHAPRQTGKKYVEDLGLIVTRPQIRIANRIYREVIPRELTYRVGRQDLAAQRNP